MNNGNLRTQKRTFVQRRMGTNSPLHCLAATAQWHPATYNRNNRRSEVRALTHGHKLNAQYSFWKSSAPCSWRVCVHACAAASKAAHKLPYQITKGTSGSHRRRGRRPYEVRSWEHLAQPKLQKNERTRTKGSNLLLASFWEMLLGLDLAMTSRSYIRPFACL